MAITVHGVADPLVVKFALLFYGCLFPVLRVIQFVLNIIEGMVGGFI